MMETRKLTKSQMEIIDKYSYNNYVSTLQSPKFRLSRNDILFVEHATREQSLNPLWNMLRLDRQTASGNCSYATSVPQSAAMSYGLRQEKLLKNDKFLIQQVINVIETTIGGKVVDQVLNCGMFMSEFGLFSASPDAYFVVKTTTGDDAKEVFVPLEIKCPHTYKETNFEEMRKTFGNRNDRYRVKHTALSVNKHGDFLFAVEQTDPHYRQMQRQMYVMNAPLCVYVVKFYNSYVILPVLRNETFYIKEYQIEKRLFERYVQKNRHRLLYKSEQNRLKTLTNHFSLSDAQQLAESGLVYEFGELKCIYCDLPFDIEAPISEIIDRNKQCGDSSIEKMSAISNKNYISHNKRQQSLINNGIDVKLADHGVYCTDHGALRTFCCDEQINDDTTPIKHKDYCKYYLMLK
uniref:Alkaline exonuclease n=1 Tax=Spodoptera frugiperda nuclear polyhedrosis virus TaxID=10455 RepID=A0A7G3W7P0_NPVSF|nr:alkaline exonuclease [Spodoptera frugiperda multiple nucleopolyhedrovirus]